MHWAWRSLGWVGTLRWACEPDVPGSNGLLSIPRWSQVWAVPQFGCVSRAVFQPSDYAVGVCSVAAPISIGLSRWPSRGVEQTAVSKMSMNSRQRALSASRRRKNRACCGAQLHVLAWSRTSSQCAGVLPSPHHFPPYYITRNSECWCGKIVQNRVHLSWLAPCSSYYLDEWLQVPWPCATKKFRMWSAWLTSADWTVLVQPLEDICSSWSLVS